jgi:hypothetical protein
VLIDPTGAVLLQISVLDPTAQARFSWPLPPNAPLRGLVLRTQGFALTTQIGVVSASAVRQSL